MWAYIAFGAALGMLYQVSQLWTVPQLHCTAKLVASPTFMASKRDDRGYIDYDPSTVPSFAATLVETLESPELRRRARERVRALNPELAESEVGSEPVNGKGAQSSMSWPQEAMVFMSERI